MNLTLPQWCSRHTGQWQLVPQVRHLSRFFNAGYLNFRRTDSSCKIFVGLQWSFMVFLIITCPRCDTLHRKMPICAYSSWRKRKILMYLGLHSHQRQQVNVYDILGVRLHQCLSPKATYLPSKRRSSTAFGELRDVGRESLWVHTVDWRIKSILTYSRLGLRLWVFQEGAKSKWGLRLSLLVTAQAARVCWTWGQASVGAMTGFSTFKQNAKRFRFLHALFHVLSWRNQAPLGETPWKFCLPLALCPSCRTRHTETHVSHFERRGRLPWGRWRDCEAPGADRKAV